MLTPCVLLLANQNSAILVFVHFMGTPEQCSLRRDDLRVFVHAILSGSLLCTLVDPSYDRAFAWMWYHPYQGKSLLPPCPLPDSTVVTACNAPWHYKVLSFIFRLFPLECDDSTLLPRGVMTTLCRRYTYSHFHPTSAEVKTNSLFVASG